MQLIQAFLMVTILCVATINAENPEFQNDIRQPSNDTDTNTGKDSVAKGFDVNKVEFSVSDPSEEGGENVSKDHTPLIAAVGACACVGVLGAVYMKRRKQNEKLPGEIFTIDDKNSVL
ncbi:uncharacterized protein PHALS_00331 [Plasmopara halstedii]|uniref:RxLR-like protein n=1 Tax=Plasmopara halstedii TaxID=4781 RepID=A0A0P1A600_PLAHL|nr:uncharacterized protein PHALS_00331 [Plasmopara halstedii]CEG36009.1 hypothetical protein PHALS_00331 [Plasmopara halstedii]|eukprot:XP_024572378.1 hypothetical protein PHALS_00331 [Plasmopara halstedii]